MLSRIKILTLQLLLLMLLFQHCRLLFIIFNQPIFCNIDWLQYPNYIIRGVKFDLAAICIINTPFILLSVLPFKFCKEKFYQYSLMILYSLVNTVALIANFADIFYYPYTLKRITSSIFDYLGTQANMGSLGKEFFFTYWYAFVLLLLLVSLLIGFFHFSIKKLSPANSFNYKKAVGVWILCGYLVLAGGKNNLNLFGQSLQINDAIDDVEQIEYSGIVLNSAFTLASSLLEDRLNKNQLQTTQTYTDSPLNYQYKNTEDFRADNVVIIILESFTREVIKSLNANLDNGEYSGHAPFLDSLMCESLYYTNASANGRKSMDALPAILASIPANETPFILAKRTFPKFPSLASCLRTKGYQTFFFHGSHNTSMGFANFCKQAGIEKYYGLNEYPNPNDFDGTWGIWDEPYLKYMAHELDRCKKPFLASVFTLSSHNPYVIPKKYEHTFPKGTEEIHETMHYTDYALRQFFKTASTMSWYKNTLFVITADHAITPWHKEYATSDKAFAVPLFFYTPNNSLKGKCEERAQHIDIFPTVLSYLNYDTSFNSLGNNLLDDKIPKFTVNIVNRCYQMTSGEYLILYDGQKCKALFNIKNDPCQKKNIVKQNPKLVNQMLNILINWIQKYNQCKLYPVQ